MRDGAVPGADEGSDNESSSELEWRQEWDTDSRWRPWAVHPDPIGMRCQLPPHSGLWPWTAALSAASDVPEVQGGQSELSVISRPGLTSTTLLQKLLQEMLHG